LSNAALQVEEETSGLNETAWMLMIELANAAYGLEGILLGI